MTSTSESTLYYLEDILERALMPFFLLGETAKSVVEGTQVEGRIEIGVRRTSLTKYARGALKMYFPQIADDLESGKKIIEFEHEGTQVRMKVIEKLQHSSMFKNLDQTFYRVTQFGLPNPFNRYWKMRNLVR